jgi:hypothetical protein
MSTGLVQLWVIARKPIHADLLSAQIERYIPLGLGFVISFGAGFVFVITYSFSPGPSGSLCAVYVSLA